jgi:membrane-anchored glycerophosphoryl diester phosphodiesterase (GDPDase)
VLGKLALFCRIIFRYLVVAPLSCLIFILLKVSGRMSLNINSAGVKPVEPDTDVFNQDSICK